MRIIGYLLLMMLVLSGCQKQEEIPVHENSDIQQSNTSKKITQKKEMNEMNMKLLIKDKEFFVRLIDHEATNQLIQRLPMQVTMNDLHRNEKYVYLDQSLPTLPKAVGSVQAGDVMLFGSDCLVIFYESFSTSYTYTKIGTITDMTGFKEAVGTGSVVVSFQEMKEE